MAHPHDSMEVPRHERLFELIRQTNVAHDASARAVISKPQSASEIRKFMHLAAQSLEPGKAPGTQL